MSFACSPIVRAFPSEGMGAANKPSGQGAGSYFIDKFPETDINRGGTLRFHANMVIFGLY